MKELRLWLRPSGICRVLVVCLLAGAAGAQTHAPPPRLVVVIVVDQFRADYIDRYGYQWAAGLRRLINDGARFDNAAYPYRSTVTCAGHATIATGTLPSRHGMVMNSWWDRERGEAVTCTTDPSATPIAYGNGDARERHSPAPLLVPTIADRLRQDGQNGARIVSLSLKPRSAIMLAGKAADAIAWFDAANTWATSSAYGPAPVAEVQRFIADHPVEEALGHVWDRRFDAEEYLHTDDGVGTVPPPGWSDHFPHPLGDTADQDFYGRWKASPSSDRYLTAMASSLLAALELGQAERTDYLSIGYSALDYVGHRFGPDSHEVQDLLVRLDATLGELLDTLDLHVGPDRYVVALSSDHGVSPVPERAAAEGIDAGRTGGRSLEAEVEALLTERLGPGPYVASKQSGDLYFLPGVYDALRSRPGDLDAVVALITTMPGMWRVYRGDRLHAADKGDPVTRAVSLSYYEGRSGDLIIVPKPFWIGQDYAATHGSPYGYDTKIPVVLYGSGVAAGRYPSAASPADIAPTLARIVGLTLPEADGRVLDEALLLN